MKKTVLLIALLLALSLCTVGVSASTYNGYGGEDAVSGETADAGTGASLATDEIVTRIAISFLVALVISLVIVFLMKSSLNTVHRAKSANSYTKEGSFALTECRDIFLYSTVTRVRVNTDSNKRR